MSSGDGAVGGAAPGGRGSNTVTGYHGRPQVGCQRYLGGSQRRGCLGWTEDNGQPLGQAGKEAKTSRGQRKDRDPGGGGRGAACAGTQFPALAQVSCVPCILPTGFLQLSGPE